LSEDENPSIDGNSRWAVNGGHGISNEPADYRISMMLFGNQFDTAILGISFLDTFNLSHYDYWDMDVLYNTALGPGHVFPDVFGENSNPYELLGFLNSDFISSMDAGIDGKCWNDRNPMLTLLVPLLGMLHEGSSIEEDKYPISWLVRGLLPVLLKPYYYYQKETTDGSPFNCWKPRLNGDNNYLKQASTLDDDPGKTWLEERETYYEPKSYKSAMRNMMIPRALILMIILPGEREGSYVTDLSRF